jgi:hypothetical protein
MTFMSNTGLCDSPSLYLIDHNSITQIKYSNISLMLKYQCLTLDIKATSESVTHHTCYIHILWRQSLNVLLEDAFINCIV